MIFTNREEAAQLLAKRLSAYEGKHPLVLAIPRGALPMGKIVADALRGELNVVLVRKLGAPGQPEYAIGSVDEAGHVTMNPDAVGLVPESYVKREVQRQLDVMRERRARYTPVRSPADPAGRITIVVDDGIATGSTMIAALHATRHMKPQKLVAAIGVAPTHTLRRIEAIADEVVCLHSSDEFFAVGQFFAEFPQVSDDEVVDILKGAKPVRTSM
jgi:predicted phosphoribosyltransferase